MATATRTAEVRVHEAILSSLQLAGEAAVACSEQARDCAHVQDIIGSIKRYLQAHVNLMNVLKAGDFSKMGDEHTLKLTFNLRELADNVSEAMDQGWQIAPHLTSCQDEYCCLLRDVAHALDETEDVAETWCLSVNPETRQGILAAVQDAQDESSNRSVSDWRDFFATL